MSLHSLLHTDSLLHASDGVLSLELLQLTGRVLIKELINTQEPTTNSDIDLVLVNTHVDLLGPELIDTLTFTQEHNLELSALWVIVDVLGKLLVDAIVLNGDVHCNPRLEVYDVRFQGVNLGFTIL